MRWALVVLMLSTGVARAEVSFPVQVPGECQGIAAKNGFGAYIESKMQLLRALRVLRSASAAEPGVVDCKTTVKRMIKGG